MHSLTENQQKTKSKGHYCESPACLQHWSLPERTCSSPQSVYRGGHHPSHLLAVALQTVDLFPVKTNECRKGSVKSGEGERYFFD
jgi:hypothetical protein